MKLLLAIVLAGYAAGIHAADPVVPTSDLRTVTVEVTWYATPREVTAALKAARVHNVPRTGVNGFSFTTSDGVCHVHALRPREVDTSSTTTFGHEALHCFLGNYHP